jgi:hypothetical protein
MSFDELRINQQIPRWRSWRMTWEHDFPKLLHFNAAGTVLKIQGLMEGTFSGRFSPVITNYGATDLAGDADCV